MNALTSSQVTSYAKNGFLLVRNIFNKSELEKLLDESARLWGLMTIDETNRRIQWRKRVDGGRIADRIDPVLDISPPFEKAANDPRITCAASQLLQCTHPEIFKSKLISKWPQTTGYALHQDYTYWPGLGNASPDDFITALIALDCFEVENGAPELFPSLHRSALAPPADQPRDVDESEVDLAQRLRAILEPGDVVFFHPMTPHRSGPNLSSHNRQSLFFTYVAPGYDNLGEYYYASRPDDFMESQ